MTRLIACSILLALAGCSQEPAEDESVLARVGDREITVEEFTDELERRAAAMGGNYGTRDQQRALLAALVDHERLLATAEALELDHDPEVQAAVERVLTSAVRRELEARSLAEVTVSDEEVQDWYEARRDDYARPERRNAAIIQSVTVTDADRERLRSVAREAADTGGKHFGELAIDHSDDQSSRYRGGVIGWLAANRRDRYKWPQPVVDAIFELSEEGEVSSVIETEEGLFIARLVALEAGGARPLAEVEDGIRAALRREKIQAARERALEDMSNGIEVVVHDERLDRIEPRNIDSADRKPPALPGRSDS